MTKNYVKVLFLVMVGSLLFGCVAGQVQTTNTPFVPYTLEAGQYEPKVDNFMVILDQSASMSWKYNGERRLTIAKDFLSAMNQTLPEMKLNGALRSFGPVAGADGKPTSIFYGLTQYSTKGFQKALNAAQETGGTSPMEAAIAAAGGDLNRAQGQLAVIIVSDGEDMGSAPIAAARNMKMKFGDRLCIYTVLVGNNADGEALMKQVAAAGGCGFSVRADSFKTSGDMGDFVRKVFLAGRVKPAAPLATRRPEPLDSDGDGVYDDLDKCPNTPHGARVDEQGCWILGGVLFYTNKSDIKQSVYPDLDAVVTILKNNPALNIEIRGHTDNVGRAAYNMKLSESRAKAVMDYFVEKGIDPQRLSAKGFGLTMPTASNDTEEGRAKNRRVELRPVR